MHLVVVQGLCSVQIRLIRNASPMPHRRSLSNHTQYHLHLEAFSSAVGCSGCGKGLGYCLDRLLEASPAAQGRHNHDQHAQQDLAQHANKVDGSHARTHKVDLSLVPLGTPLDGGDVVVEGAGGPAEQEGPDLQACLALSASSMGAFRSGQRLDVLSGCSDAHSMLRATQKPSRHAGIA